MTADPFLAHLQGITVHRHLLPRMNGNVTSAPSTSNLVTGAAICANLRLIRTMPQSSITMTSTARIYSHSTSVACTLRRALALVTPRSTPSPRKISASTRSVAICSFVELPSIPSVLSTAVALTSSVIEAGKSAWNMLGATSRRTGTLLSCSTYRAGSMIAPSKSILWRKTSSLGSTVVGGSAMVGDDEVTMGLATRTHEFAIGKQFSNTSFFKSRRYPSAFTIRFLQHCVVLSVFSHSRLWSLSRCALF